MMKVCKDCKLEKDLKEFPTPAKYKGKIYYRSICRKCCNSRRSKDIRYKQQAKEYRDTPEFHQKRNAYRRTEKYRTTERLRDRQRREQDPLYRTKKALRERTRHALIEKRWEKTIHYSQYIGCTQQELKIHLEKQFQPEMTWDNYGQGEDKWTIDHKIPLSSAKTIEDLYNLCHYTNLQPMWFIDNIKKGNKIE